MNLNYQNSLSKKKKKQVNNIAFQGCKHVERFDVDNWDVYAYSIEVILMNLILLLSILGISIIGNCLILFVGYILFYIPIRIFAGGYHAKDSSRCYILSLGLYIVLAGIYRLLPELYGIA